MLISSPATRERMKIADSLLKASEFPVKHRPSPGQHSRIHTVDYPMLCVRRPGAERPNYLLLSVNASVVATWRKLVSFKSFNSSHSTQVESKKLKVQPLHMLYNNIVEKFKGTIIKAMGG